MRVVTFTILGEPASKANSRKIVTMGQGENKRAAVIKSEKALNYVDSALQQVPPHARQRIEGPVFFTARIFYASERPDLDESVILDLLQDQWKRDKKTKARHLVQHGVYVNDRQVKGKYITWHLDPLNPRAEITVEEMQPDPEWAAAKKRKQAAKKMAARATAQQALAL